MINQAEVVQLPLSDPREAPEARRLEQALANIHADAREQARRYQDETRVPEGGE
ncbi:MAG TPA: hypothetical protein VK034_09400 [Enhygromyxa sp.]|nr:hypothetical protein [Enhygromyxa sp.]